MITRESGENGKNGQNGENVSNTQTRILVFVFVPEEFGVISAVACRAE